MSKQIVMDANILIRGLLGNQVPQLLEQYGAQVRFFTARQCYEEVRQHLPTRPSPIGGKVIRNSAFTIS